MANGYFILTLCCLCAALSKTVAHNEQAMKEFMEVAENCRIEVGASTEDLENCLKGVEVPTKEGKCLKACVMKKMKMMNDDGKFDRSSAMEHVKMWVGGDAEKMKTANKILDHCGGIQVSDDHCEAAFELAHCFHEQMKVHGIKDMDL